MSVYRLKQDQKDPLNLPKYRVRIYYAPMKCCVHCEGQGPTELQPLKSLNTALRSFRLGLNLPQPKLLVQIDSIYLVSGHCIFLIAFMST